MTRKYEQEYTSALNFKYYKEAAKPVPKMSGDAAME